MKYNLSLIVSQFFILWQKVYRIHYNSTDCTSKRLLLCLKTTCTVSAHQWDWLGRRQIEPHRSVFIKELVQSEWRRGGVESGRRVACLKFSLPAVVINFPNFRELRFRPYLLCQSARPLRFSSLRVINMHGIHALQFILSAVVLCIGLRAMAGKA